MPVIRHRFIPEIESTGLAKRCFDVLLWGNDWSKSNAYDLDILEILRTYLRSLEPRFVGIRVRVPKTHTESIALLQNLDCNFSLTETTAPEPDLFQKLGEEELATAVQTAIAEDVDALVVGKQKWFPYVEDVEKLGVLLTDTGHLKYQCEIFARGHDVPWAFEHPRWGATWTAFYQLTEPNTFKNGMDFLVAAGQKKVNEDGQETGRSLVHNRLPNICFTRDRLLFYEIQRFASIRNRWKRQSFVFEIGYYLNFYYLVIFGGFDQLALMVSQMLNLGLPEKNVGATYKGFLDVLKARSTSLYNIFTDTKHVEFIKRIAYLRHYASHRGSVMPTTILNRPDKEPTNEELDADIAEEGMDMLLNLMPAKERDAFRLVLRSNARFVRYEKAGVVMDGVVPIVIDGQQGFIHPASDIGWNCERFLFFANQVFDELGNCI
jgi:hypothetical protein